MSDDSELGKKLQNTINHGELVSDEIIIQIIKEAIKSPSCYKGFVLDGFPRTLRQAELLDEFLREQNKKLDGVLSFQVNDDVSIFHLFYYLYIYIHINYIYYIQELIDRIQGRLVHPKSGRSYHIHLNPPKVPGKDDITGENLVHRVDDTCEILQYRLQQYNTSTAPLLQYYKQKDLLHIINGNQPIDQVSKQIVNVLKSV